MIASNRMSATLALLMAVMCLGCTANRISGPAASPSASPPPLPFTADLVLFNGTLIDGSGGDPIPDAFVAIAGDRIVAVGPRAGLAFTADESTVDLEGAWILPGFINAHVHEAGNRESLKAWAQSGVTTVRDLGALGSVSGLFAVRDEVASDSAYARLVLVGPMVTAPGGYGRQPVDSPEDARRNVNSLLDDGADLIKIAIEDNLQGRTWPMLPVAEIETIVETAHARDTLVVAHVSRSKHLEMALAAGVDDVTHMAIDPLSDGLIARLVEAGIYWEPTLELWQCASNLHAVELDLSAIENLRRFSEAGGKVVLGTDYAGYRCQFDLGMPTTEIDLMHQAGMTPMQIIVAATLHAAHVCNLDQELGTLEPGKIADVLVVRGNPLQDLQVLTNVQMVVHNGVVIRQ